MSRLIINEYITSHYERWRQYAFYQCYSRGIGEDAEDVLGDAVYVLLCQDEDKALSMIDQSCDGCTRMDLFFYTVIKYKAMSHAKKSFYRRNLMQSICSEAPQVSYDEFINYETLNDPSHIKVILSEPNARSRCRESRQRKDIFLSGMFEI